MATFSEVLMVGATTGQSAARVGTAWSVKRVSDRKPGAGAGAAVVSRIWRSGFARAGASTRGAVGPTGETWVA